MEKTKEPGIVDNLVKEGKIHPLTVELINLEKMCRIYGWTPDQVDDMDPFILEAFENILIGQAEGVEVPKPKK